jgi:hypothetical protein
MSSTQINQMYVTLKALFAVVTEMNSCVSEATQELEHQMFQLDELMKPFVGATVEMVRALREITGEGMTACNKALIEARGNQQLAIKILRGF